MKELIAGFILAALVHTVIFVSAPVQATPGHEPCVIIERDERDTIQIMDMAYTIGGLQIRINELEVMLSLSKPQVYR